MAREMGSIELHKRDQVQAAQSLEGTEIGARFAKSQFSTAGHEVTIANATSIMDTCSLPTFSPQTAQFQYGSTEICAKLHAKSEVDPENPCWDNASRCWRGAFFQRGLVIKRIDTEESYASLGMVGSLLVAAWKGSKVH